MPHDHRERLRNIRQFHQLVEYLCGDLQWPIETDDFEDLTFDYEAEDLGLDFKTAAKIQQIKQLRPLVTNQPWGIFFVQFEPKRLPVVALRRILGRLVIKKRASANTSELASWQLNDLLFISSYGEGDNRQISLAHFSENEQFGDLPTLRVLGWDGNDRDLKLDHVHNELQTKLCWPEDDTDLNAWREQWSSVFTLRNREVITTSQQLAVRLAALASSIRRKVNAALAVETEHGPMRKLMKAFQEALIHDLKADDFADMYAQTIAYGLLSARVSRQSGALVVDDVALMVPIITSPFLRELMETFLHLGGRKQRGSVSAAIDFDELGINYVVDLLRQANMEAVLHDFDNRNPQEDPVLHFYELFLKEYDAKERMQRGVFYTPKPVVSYIVRSVHELLQHEFGLEDGLADTATWQHMCERHPDITIPKGVLPDQPFVQILDPATGTATFLVEVIDVIHWTLTTKWKKQGLTDAQQRDAWNEYVPKHLLPRLHGYELMMAPYAIAHMKIGLKLYETGYRFGSDERARIYLTNALEPPQDFSDRLAFDVPALAHEAQAVNAVKRHQHFTVVIGNPPYAAASSNNGSWISDLIAVYKESVRDEETQIRTLSDDYVKFLRLAQAFIESASIGIVGMITNSGFTDGVIFRGMRRQLLTAFSSVAILDLHGHGRRSQSAEAAGMDENVFDILVGTSISLLVKHHEPAWQATLFRADVLGSRTYKYAFLTNNSWQTTQWTAITPEAPLWLYRTFDAELGVEYQEWIPFLALWGTGNERQDRHSIYGFGIKTQQDEFAIAFDSETVIARVQRLLAPNITEEALRQEYRLCKTNQWSFLTARRRLATSSWHKRIVPILYRPFDVRFTCYVPDVVTNPRPKVMAHLLNDNIALCVSRQVGGGDRRHVFVAQHLVDNFAVSLSSKEGCHVFPLSRAAEEGEESPQRRIALSSGSHCSHLNPTRATAIARALGLQYSESPQGECVNDGILAPNDILNYIYAVFHSPSYRSRYAEFLKTDFPRLPLTRNLDLFRALARLGSELVSLHLMESPQLKHHLTTYVGPANPEVERVSYSRDTVWLDKAQTRGFCGVPEDVWNFHIGGYQVCEKWLKDRQAKGGKNPRPGRQLNEDDMNHYQRIVVALHETIRLMSEIDEVIDQHGGWPDAFMTEPVHREETDATEPSA